MLILTALSASSVAPAQVTPGTEPLLASGSKDIPVPVIPAVLTPELPQAVQPQLLPDAADPVQPTDDVDAIEPKADLASMVDQMRSTEAGSDELECLAGAIYFESKSEPLKGQLAVGHVIANRAKSGRFPSSYCGVVYQRGQFSFVRGHSMPHIARSGRQWQTAVAIAKIVDEHLKPAPMPKALFFHAKRVSPNWHLARVGAIGNHVFYR